MREDAKPSKHQLYTYIKNNANTIKDKVNKLLDEKFICKIEHVEGVSALFVFAKKNKKIRVCVSQNIIIAKHNYPSLIIGHVLGILQLP